MSKFKVGDFVSSKVYSYVVEVIFVEAETFTGRFVEGTKKNQVERHFHEDNFEKVIKEDKMEEIRVVRKLEDLDGLENGFGARIQRIQNSIYMQVLVNDKSLYDFNISEVSGEKYFNEVIGVLKAMGFKFEFQKLRTVEEVLEEMKANSLNPYCDNLFEVRCELNYEKNKSIYSVFKNIYSVTLGAYAFEKETAQKYADELNEIVGGK